MVVAGPPCPIPPIRHTRTMSGIDFDVESLARYLHIAPSQVTRMAERGKLPGRKVGGQWRFSRPDIHHWLEDRIGLSDDEELAAVEAVLDRSDTAVRERIIDLMPLEAIALPLVAKTRSSVISSMCQLAAGTGWLWDPQRMAELVKERESLHPTALETGVALLHPRRPQPSLLAQAVVALGITPRGIPFGGPVTTDVFFLIGSTSDAEHLRILARLSRILQHEPLVDSLRTAADAHEARALIEARESELE